MKILSSLVLCFYFIFSTAIASEIKAELNIHSETAILKEGDLAEGVFRIWPIENADFNEFRKLQGMNFFNSLNLVQIHSIDTSVNNADVVEVKGLFLVKNEKKQTLNAINYKGQSIQLMAPPIKIMPLEKRSDDYFILDQSVSYSNIQKILMAIIAGTLIVLGFWKRGNIKQFLKKFRHDPTAIAIKRFNEKFLKASTREDFEEIYSLRNDWFKLVKIQASAYQEFFKVMNQHQYKKNWGTEELSEVQSSFDIIRGSFK